MNFGIMILLVGSVILFIMAGIKNYIRAKRGMLENPEVIKKRIKFNEDELKEFKMFYKVSRIILIGMIVILGAVHFVDPYFVGPYLKEMWLLATVLSFILFGLLTISVGIIENRIQKMKNIFRTS